MHNTAETYDYVFDGKIATKGNYKNNFFMKYLKLYNIQLSLFYCKF